MIIRCICSCLLAASLSIHVAAQEKTDYGAPWMQVHVDTKASLRGLHVRSASEIWASGTGGTIVNSTDGGKSWRVQIVAGAEQLDFRDIQAIGSETVVAITSGTPARIYRTDDGGSNWKQVFEHKDERVFLDALSFWDGQHGIVMGDPIDGQLFLLITSDGGNSWTKSKTPPVTDPGEAGFAASGTNMITTGRQNIFIALGGNLDDQVSKASRIMVSRDGGLQWTASAVPVGRNPSAGIFSLCFANSKNGVAVGGDYLKPDVDSNNYALTTDGGATWSVPTPRRPPSGFRSCAASWIDHGDVKLITVGPNGTDLSNDFGGSWRRVSSDGYHALDFSPDHLHGWASGSDGRIAKWIGFPAKK